MATNPNIRFGGNQLHDVATPSLGTDAANKAYVDLVVQGLDAKPSARALASVAIGTLSGLATTIDGVSFTVDGMRALLTAEASQINNGPWLVHAGAWTRPADFAAGSFAAGAFMFIEQGTLWSDTGWVCTADTGSDVVGTNNLPWVQFSAAGVISVTGGLTKVGSVVSVANADGTLVVTTGDVRRAAISGDVVVASGSNVSALANSSVTLAKMANLAAQRLIGNDTGSGAPVALTVTGGLEFTGAGGIQRSALTGDVTASAGSGTTTIAAHAVTYSKFQQDAGASVLAVSGSPGDPNANYSAITGTTTHQFLGIQVTTGLGFYGITANDLPSSVTGARILTTRDETATLNNSFSLAVLGPGVLQQTVGGSPSTASLTAVSISAGRIAFGAASGGGLATDSVVVVDGTNHRLGVGTATPSYTLEVLGMTRHSGATGINANPDAEAFAYLQAQITGDRDRVHVHIGGAGTALATTASIVSYSDWDPTSTNLATASTIAALFTHRLRAQVFSASSSTITDNAPATLVVDGPPSFIGGMATPANARAIRVKSGDVAIDSGNLLVTGGHVTVDGNVATTAGSLVAGTNTIPASGGITFTGAITATGGVGVSGGLVADSVSLSTLVLSLVDSPGGGGTATLATVGGSGPPGTAQHGWARAMVGANNVWIPYWQ